ncbi:MAG: ATP-binding protein [Acidimicrobiia bacterium]|nr:ATP-binding protein [Acidimicrobiia bacterium]
MAPGKRFSGGVRFHTTAFAVMVVGVAMLVGVLLLYLAAQASLTGSIKEATASRADAIAAFAANDSLPAVLATGSDVIAAQVLDASGAVVAQSVGIEGRPGLTDLQPPAGSRTNVTDANDLPDELERWLARDVEGPIYLEIVGVPTPGGPVTVVAAAVLDIEDSIATLLALMAVAYPLLLGLVGITVWWVTGRALDPVESMRVEADRITHTDLHRRLPVPASDDEVRRLAETMNEMLGRLEASADQHYQFVADASHELKSPVAAIRTMLEVARANPGTVDFETLVDDLLHEDLRLEMLVGDLLTLARADEQALSVELVEVDLDDLVRSEVRMVVSRSSAPVDLSAVDPVRVAADPDRLRQLLRNLLDNSVRHARSRVWVETGRRGDEAVLIVSNDGDPIEPAERERIFERFVRLDDARSRDAGGTGLGLPVVQAIARAHGGEVAAVEPLHDGATFEVRLPAP